MTNPLSDKGWSDRDYARAVGTLMGEAWGGSKRPASTLDDYELIADVIANRKESSHHSYRGKSIDELLRDPKEFSAWGKKQGAARSMATKGMAAVLGKREDKLTGIAKQKHDLAVKALDNIFGNQSRRGVSKGSDRYNNPSAGKSSHHDPVAREKGSVTAGLHRATGPDFDPNAGPPSYARSGEFGTPREAIDLAGMNAERERSYRDFRDYTDTLINEQVGNPDLPAAVNLSANEAPRGLSISALETGVPVAGGYRDATAPYGFSTMDASGERPGRAGYGVPGAMPPSWGLSDLGFGAPAGAFSFGADARPTVAEGGPFAYGMSPDYADITRGLYEAREAPFDFNAITGGLPADDSTGSTRGSRMSAANAPSVTGQPTSVEQAVMQSPIAEGPYSFSDLNSAWSERPNAATIEGDVTGFGQGSPFGGRAGFDFAEVVNDSFGPGGAAVADIPARGSQEVGARAMPTGGGLSISVPEDYGRTYPDISRGMYPGEAVTAATSPFSPSSLGPSTGFRDYGNYDAINNPVGYSTREFSHAINQPAPRGVVGYETVTKEVPNPAWSDWNREFGTKNALQDAWLNADKDKFSMNNAFFVDPVPAVPAAPIPVEPPKTRPEVTRTPVYADRPAVNAQPVSAKVSTPSVRVSAPTARPSVAAAAPVAAPAATGWWDSFVSSLGNLFSGSPGLSLAALGGPSVNIGSGWGAAGVEGTGAGGAFSGGFTGGDAGYSSDVRSGRDGGYGNLYS